MSDDSYDQILEGLALDEPRKAVKRSTAPRQKAVKGSAARPKGTQAFSSGSARTRTTRK